MKEQIESIQQHRSIRKYKPDAIPPEVLHGILESGIRASNTGSMQLYSVIVTQDKKLIEELSPLHFNQPMVKQAPVHVTLCADVHRFHQWCEQRGAEPGYDNLLWFMNATVDAALVSQNMALEAENQGLGICYLGTCLFNAKGFVEILKMPKGVFPVATMVMGYPDEDPPLTPRFPLNGVVHNETYQPYSEDAINEIWKETENSDLTKELKELNKKENLALIFTENRYKKTDNLHFTKTLIETLKEQGFLD